MKPKVIVILGPTATGKSDLAVKIAKKINGLNQSKGLVGRTSRGEVLGEIISADSRQVYKGLDIVTGKITKIEMKGVPHHLLDVASPKKIFTVSDWKKLAEKKLEGIVSRNKTPIICGGTGFYIQSVVDNIILPEVPPNEKLRKKLGNKSPEELFKILFELDPNRAESIEKEQGSKNPVRLVRAIEVATTLGSVPKISQGNDKYEFIQIGLRADPEKLKKKIQSRVFSRLKSGMINEAKRLHQKGLSYKRMRFLGLEYRYLADFLAKPVVTGRPTQTKSGFRKNKISRDDLIEKIYKGNVDYAKRQMTWFKRDKRIKWFDVEKKDLVERVLEYIQE